MYSLLANGVIAFLLIVCILLLTNFQKLLVKHLKSIISVTVGTLFALIFFKFIPEISGELSPKHTGVFLLIGLLVFYILELVLHWHHCIDLEHQKCSHGHRDDHENHGKLMFTGTLLHNVFHGMVIYSAFLVSTKIGIVLSLGILLHSIPQNIANYVMNHENKRSVILAAVGGVVGVIISVPFGSLVDSYKYYVLAITAGGLLYLSLSDILPSVNSSASVEDKFKTLILVVVGILIVQVFDMILNFAL